ncbi:MAG: acetone carboxylase subunit gamma [Rhodospirillales bacterium]|nr:acetone carboxylase subunit gamma [Rhodospirillales bacterium]
MTDTHAIDKELVRQLVNGTIAEDDATRLLKMARKDKDRFRKYIEVLQEEVDWNDPILLRLTDKLYIVRNDAGDRVVKCECGQEFGDYRQNWKMKCRVRTRRTPEEINQVYDPEPAAPEAEWQEIREFICPCPKAAQMAVEVVAPGYPAVFEMIPDLDTFYRDVLGDPLPDEDPNWYQDQTSVVTSAWAGTGKTS